jgi:hypothetical protein
LEGVADRVSLGLLPAANDGWPIAIHVLKHRGGWLHVHANVADARPAPGSGATSSSGHGTASDHTASIAWSIETANALLQLARNDSDSRKHSWQVSVRHIEFVKWYAPRVRHLVVDIYCGHAHDIAALPPPSHPAILCDNPTATPVVPSPHETKGSRGVSTASTLVTSVHHTPISIHTMKKEAGLTSIWWSSVIQRGTPLLARDMYQYGFVDRHRWSFDYLKQQTLVDDPSNTKKINVLVNPSSRYDPTTRNYSNRSMNLSEFVARAIRSPHVDEAFDDQYFITPDERYYLPSTHKVGAIVLCSAVLICNTCVL